MKSGKFKKVIIAVDNDITEDNQGGIPCARYICSYIKENYPDITRRWKLSPLKYGKDWNKVLQTIFNLKKEMRLNLFLVLQKQLLE